MIDLTDPQYKTEDGSALRIWRDAAPNKYLTEHLARPIFDDVIFVEVISPGSRDSSPVFELVRYYNEASDQPEPGYGSKYKEYEKYVNDFLGGENADKSLTGTPLSVWPEMTRSLAMSFRAQEIYTVDALAQVPDSALPKLGPEGRKWREKAAAYLDAAKGGAGAAAALAELEVARNDNEDLKRQVTELSQAVAELQAKNTSEVEATLRQELADAKAQIAKFDGDKDGKIGGAAPAVPPAPVTEPTTLPSII